MNFESIKDLLEKEEKTGVPVWKIIMETDAAEKGISCEESAKTMKAMWEAIKNASASYDAKLKSASGLSGGNAAAVRKYVNSKKAVCGEFIGEVMAEALAMGESNVCMRRIVAAPTAGSCGVLPAVLIPYTKKHNVKEEKIIQSLYIFAGFGAVTASRASISGAEGGCQAEIGSASAMAAAALTYLIGGTSEQSAHAFAIALKSVLGLTCDPVAGLVEVPCIKRNVMGAVNAVTAADMAMAGLKSAIPADEVIDTMKEIGDNMSLKYRETSTGGLAVTKTGREIAEKLFSEN